MGGKVVQPLEHLLCVCLRPASKARVAPGLGTFSEPEGPNPEEVSAAANAEW